MGSFTSHTDSQTQGGVLRISSDGDDRRIFLGLKFLISGFFWVRKFGKYCFGWLDLSRDFLGGIRNNLKIRGNERVSRPRSSANKVRPNLFLPRWSCLELSFIMLLLKQKMFLGVPSVFRMTTR